MKKTLLALVAVLGFAGAASAQDFQFQAGYGGYTQMDASNMAGGANVNTSWGAVTGGFTVRILPGMRVGASYSFSSASYKDNAPGNAYYHSVMFNVMYDYYRRGALTIYSHVGMGVDISHMSTPGYSFNKTYYAYQASPFGAEYNIGSGCNLFGEVGYGAQGLLQVGVRVKL
ncbi:MAG: porin family protein [Muribaculaceae bacterium]|nr:porin family protein [Muribaculaceae bacterium]